MLDASDLVALAAEYKDYVSPTLSALAALIVRESPRLLRWAVQAGRFAGRVAYACVVRPDSEIVTSLLKAIESGEVVQPAGCRVRVEAGEFSIAPPCEIAGGTRTIVNAAGVWRGGIDVTAGLAPKELKKVVKAAEARIKAVRKAADEANAAAARSLVSEGLLRGN